MKIDVCHTVTSPLFGRLAISGLMAMMLFSANAQQSNTFYLMHEVPQSNLLNPAVRIPCKWFVGIPGLASTHLSYSNTAFSYNDLAAADTWNLEGIFDQMHRVDLYSVEAQLNPIAVGFKLRSFYITFNIAERVKAYQTIPKDLPDIALHGNGPFIGETARFDALRTNLYYNRQYSLGASKVVDQYWTVGIRAKLLFGKANLYSGQSDLGFNTEENQFNIYLNGAYTLNSSLPITYVLSADGRTVDDVLLDDINYASFLLNRSNTGIGIDLGVLYRLDDRTTLSASLLDLGFIRWKSDLNNLEANGSFAYEGIAPGDDVISMAFVNDMIDSISNAYDFSVTQLPYTSYIPAQLYLGGTYQLKEYIKLGVVNRNVFFRSKIHSSFTLLGQADLADRLLATLSWSYLNNSLKNIGAGIAYHGKGFQFHLVSDNLLGFLTPFATRTVNLRAGFNVMFGCPRNKKEQLEGESYGRSSRGGDCSWSGKPINRDKQLKKAARKQVKM